MKKSKKINEKHLTAYTAAASVALLAAAPVNADIQYTPADVLLSNNNYLLDMDGDTNPEFDFTAFWTSTYQPGYTNPINGSVVPGSGFMYASAIVNNYASGAFWLANGSSLPENLTNGDPISGTTTNWDNGTEILFSVVRTYPFYGGTSTGNFGPSAYAGPGYLGVKFDLAGTDLYGWIHIDSVDPKYELYHIDGWAYEDDGSSILAGEMPTVVPEPSSMALFAAGAAGLAAFRKRKKK